MLHTTRGKATCARVLVGVDFTGPGFMLMFLPMSHFKLCLTVAYFITSSMCVHKAMDKMETLIGSCSDHYFTVYD